MSDKTQATQPSGEKPYLVYLIAMVAAVGGFLFGYDLSIISGVMLFMKPEFCLTPAQFGFAMASALLGCIAGPLLGGTLSDRWGRKWTLIFAGLLFAVGSIGTALAANIIQFELYRFWAAWAWDWRRLCRRCSLPKCRRRAFAGRW